MCNLDQAYGILSSSDCAEQKKKTKKFIENVLMTRCLLSVIGIGFIFLTLMLW